MFTKELSPSEISMILTAVAVCVPSGGGSDWNNLYMKLSADNQDLCPKDETIGSTQIAVYHEVCETFDIKKEV